MYRQSMWENVMPRPLLIIVCTAPTLSVLAYLPAGGQAPKTSAQQGDQKAAPRGPDYGPAPIVSARFCESNTALLAKPKSLHRLSLRGAAALLILSVAGCAGPQSALDPAGDGAARLATLFWVMLVGSTLIWTGVITLAFYAARKDPGYFSDRFGASLILWGGAVFPTVVLTALLTYGLWLTSDLRATGAGLRVFVTGEQYWWRVRYEMDGSVPVVSANEIRLPVGERVEFSLEAADVIHSFWIPSLGGKVDMIPGRTNRLVLQATKPGIYRGVCAEFCGPSHALMAFAVISMERTEFEHWLEAQSANAASATGRGVELFLANGCAACHAVRGTEARGTIGPDLTHIGSRRTVGAGILANTTENRARFIREVEAIKPRSRMPSYNMLTPEEATAIAAYLGSLK
jgi:cytochrome c oxidase subunit 2